MCLDDGVVTPATICDHIVPHKRDQERFWSGPFQSLCKPHHDSTKQRQERGRGSQPVDLDGWPVAAG